MASKPAACTYGATLLRVTNVSQTLGGTLILRDVNLEICDIRREGAVSGQVVALLGPSGIGKTRLFRILAGLDRPDTGQVLVGEKGVPVEAGMIGVVAQDYPLFEHRTVMGNLMVAGRQAGMSGEAARSKAEGYLREFGLDGLGPRYPTQLSGGQRQRAAIAQQFMCSEHYLLLDEPFSGLDPPAVDKVCALIHGLANADELNTIIVVTHDLAAALAVSDFVWLLGRDRDEAGHVVPGARVQETYDLVARGLAWHEDIGQHPEYLALLGEIRARFPRL